MGWPLGGLLLELAVGIEFLQEQLELVLDAEHACWLLRTTLGLCLFFGVIFGLSVRPLDLLGRLCQSLEELLRRIWSGIVPKRLNDLHCKIEVENILSNLIEIQFYLLMVC